MFTRLFMVVLGIALCQPVSAAEKVLKGIVSRPRKSQSQERLWVELHRSGQPLGFARVPVELDGRFTFHFFGPQPQPGVYELRVVKDSGRVLKQDLVSLPNPTPPLSIVLPELNDAVPVTGTVSVRQLQIPRKALRQFARADKALAAGNIDKSISFLRKAISLYPEFFEAHNNLGARYLRKREYRKAIHHLEAAIAIDSTVSDVYANLAVAHQSSGRYALAESAARRALDLDTSNARAQYMMGLALAAQGKDLAKAVEYLRGSSGQIPDAAMIADRITAAVDLRSYRQTVSQTPHPVY